MIDGRLRAVKDRVLEPVVARLPPLITPGWLTAGATAAGLAAGGLAAGGWRWSSLGAWLACRALDGLDGALARRRGNPSDLGGYLDLMGDTLGYAAVPLGIAAFHGSADVWAACAFLLASFYANAMSWTLLAAVAEKRGSGAATSGERTTIHMPTGLVEGAETIVLYSVMLAFPGWAAALFAGMALLVVLTIGQRIIWAVRSLRTKVL